MSVNRSDALLVAQRNVLEMIVLGRPLPEVLEALCRIVEEQAERPVRAAILLVDASGERLVTGAAPNLPTTYCRAIDGIAIAPEVGTCCAAAALKRPVVTRDIAVDAGWAAFRHLPLGLGLKAAWSMPIVSSSGAVVGTFGTYFLEEREPVPQERRLVEVLVHTAALAVERQRSDHALRASAARDRFLADLAAATQPLVEPAEVMAMTARRLAEHLDVARCAYAELEDDRDLVVTGDCARAVPSIVGRWRLADLGPGCARRLLAGEPFVVEDVEAHPEIAAEHAASYRAMTTRAAIFVPLRKDGRATAAVSVHEASARRWTPEEIELVELVVARCWEAIERARVTRTLRDSEARYRRMVEASPDCVKVVAPDGTLVQMNPAGLRMLEAADESQAIGVSAYDFVAPEHRARFRALNEQVCRGAGGVLEFDIVGLNGKRRSMESTAVPLPSPGGGFTQLSVSRDVSERVAAERALAESRARVDYAVRASGIGFWYCDLPFDELVWDARVKGHFFVPEHERVTIDTFYGRIHPEDRGPTREAIERSIGDHTSYDVVYRTVDPVSGATKFIRALGGTAYAADGSPRHFDGVTVDVTAQRLDQERLARALDREREQARLLQKVADAALTIHRAGSLDGALRTVTEEARRVIGARRAVTTLTNGGDAGEAVGATSVSGELGPDSYVSFDAGVAALVCGANRPLRMTQTELEAHPAWRRSGSGAPRGWLAAPLISQVGANLGLVQLSDKLDGDFGEADEAILVQLAHVATVAIENARLYDQLREHDRRKDEFLATLAHELRNPLAPIRTGLQVLRMTPDAEQVAKTREMMERQLGHLVRMVDDLLDVSRITLGKVTLKRARVDFRFVLHSALEIARPLIDARSHELSVRVPNTPLPLDVDPTRLAQVIANLLHNAAKYTEAGGRIVLSAGIESGSLLVRVSDTGVGIPADMLPKVFDMFTQVGRSIERSQGGLGIGLTLVRRLVEMHGGSVSAESPGLDAGSTFTVRLPLAADRSEALPASGHEASARGAAALRVLVVDDNVDGAEMLSMFLELNGHETRLAHTGLEALTAAAEFRPEVVFLDIGLPGLNGYEVARRLRADTSIAQPLLVALTGWGADEDRRLARAAGFDRHLVKPVDTAKVSEILMALSRGSVHAPRSVH